MKFCKALLLVSFIGMVHLGASILVLFSPQDRPATKLIQLIREAKSSIHCAVYMFTNAQIAKALLQAAQRGVEIKLIVDKSTVESDYGKALMLKQGGADVVVYNPLKISTSLVAPLRFGNKPFSDMPLMHNKFAIFDKKIVFTGSFNWTVSANTRNQENVVVIDEPEVAKSYEAHFAYLFGNTGQKVTARSLISKEAHADEHVPYDIRYDAAVEHGVDQVPMEAIA